MFYSLTSIHNCITFSQRPPSRQRPAREVGLLLVDSWPTLAVRAAISLNDLEKYTLCLEESISGSIALRSKKRFDEALGIFQQDMPGSWMTAQPIKDITEQYDLTV